MKKTLNRRSWLVAGGRSADVGQPLNTPLIPASNFVLGGDRAYARDDGTPTWAALEQIVDGLEGGPTVAFSSGMAAVAAVFDTLSVGAKVVLPEDCYHGVVGVAEAGHQRRGFSIERIAITETESWVRAAQQADLIWLESPSNPLLAVGDLKTLCAAPRKSGAILAVDNTFATPLNQRPLELGADVSIHSATKFIGGHSDLLAGTASTKSGALYEKLSKYRELAGATPGALEAFLAVRGVRTMALRLERAQRNALTLAQALVEHPLVEKTRYPGLATDPGHAFAAEQLAGFGTIVSFDVKGGAAAADAVCRHVQLIQHATSLGAVESTMERRAAIANQDHLPPGLLRLSVGIEDADDLWSDLDQALRHGAGGSS